MSADVAVKSSIFFGTPVVETTWRGQRVRVLEGQYAYKQRHEHGLAAVLSASSESTQAVRGAAASNEFGIGVMYSSQRPSAENGSSVLEGVDNFEWTEPVMLDHGSAAPNDPLFDQQWALDTIEASAAWDLVTSTDNVLIAILDTGFPLDGIHPTHEDLGSARLTAGLNVLVHSAPPRDDHGHGTHVLGIAAADRNNANGIAGLWGGRVLIIKVFNDQNDGTSISFHDGVAEAVRFAKEIGARLVVNYSGGGPDGEVKREALSRLREAGALLVAAAGNNNGGAIDFPAAYGATEECVIAVGAIDQDRQRPSFASRGSELTVVAPGVSILSTTPDYDVTLNGFGIQANYDSLNGTSQASPIVAATAAMVWSKFPSLTAAQVREKITSSATEVAGDRKDFGAGIVNARRALT
jgi:subtilisin family serine protease